MDPKSINPKHIFFYCVFLISLIFITNSGQDAWIYLTFKLFSPDGSCGNECWKFTEIPGKLVNLLIALPMAVTFGGLLQREVRSGSLPIENRVRTWFIYFSLLFIVMGLCSGAYDLINLFITGSFNKEIIINLIVWLLLILTLLIYFTQDVKRTQTRQTVPMVMAYLVYFLIVFTGIVGTFIYMDSPLKISKIKKDQEVASTMESASASILDFKAHKGQLPNSWKDVADSGVIATKSGLDLFEYKKTGEKSFVLCGNFNFNSDDTPKEHRLFPLPYKKGHYCAPFEAN